MKPWNKSAAEISQMLDVVKELFESEGTDLQLDTVLEKLCPWFSPEDAKELINDYIKSLKKAGLEKEEVIALRLYTGPMYL